jgi:hypothetical protein
MAIRTIKEAGIPLLKKEVYQRIGFSAPETGERFLMRKLMEKIGVEALAFIEENIRRGFDYEGNKFSYSTRPFFRPWHPLYKENLGVKREKENIIKLFSRKLPGRQYDNSWRL